MFYTHKICCLWNQNANVHRIFSKIIREVPIYTQNVKTTPTQLVHPLLESRFVRCWNRISDCIRTCCWNQLLLIKGRTKQCSRIAESAFIIIIIKWVSRRHPRHVAVRPRRSAVAFEGPHEIKGERMGCWVLFSVEKTFKKRILVIVWSICLLWPYYWKYLSCLWVESDHVYFIYLLLLRNS